MNARRLPEQVIVWEKKLRDAGLEHLDVRRALRQVSAAERHLIKFPSDNVQTAANLITQMISHRMRGELELANSAASNLSQDKYLDIRIALNAVSRAKLSLPEQARTVLGWM